MEKNFNGINFRAGDKVLVSVPIDEVMAGVPFKAVYNGETFVFECVECGETWNTLKASQLCYNEHNYEEYEDYDNCDCGICVIEDEL